MEEEAGIGEIDAGESGITGRILCGEQQVSPVQKPASSGKKVKHIGLYHMWKLWTRKLK